MKAFGKLSEDKSSAKSPLLKSLVYFILVATGIFIALPIALWLLTRNYLAFNLGAARFTGFIPLAIGIALTLWTTFYFPLSGKGTPLPSDPPRKLATEKVYKYSRNPQYLGAIFTLIGQAVLLESPVVLLFALLMSVLLHLLVVYFEEPGLRKRFGQAYEEYATTVPRWFLRHSGKDKKRDVNKQN